MSATESDVQLTHPKYRADIDGLRAIAVLSVVGFHAFPMWFRGGFVGVDVFFVISGYLISTILIRGLELDRFSILEFYIRRVRRIFPALLFVLAGCYAFSWAALISEEFKQFGKHLAAGAGFVSNIVLWTESGYFDHNAATKPLLHLWSLGIEEQFYILWPLILWACWKKRFHLLKAILTIGLISFLWNIKILQTDAVAAFYSPQARFWELLIGSLLAWITLHPPAFLKQFSLRLAEHQKNSISNFLAAIGLGLVVAAILVITEEKKFPGWWALMPTMGAALVISAGGQAWVNRKLLANRGFVWFGLISFPLYLWHWPLLSYAQIIEGQIPSRNIRILAVIIAIALAWVTYRFIEIRIRNSKQTRRQLFALVGLMIGIGSLGLITFQNKGFKSRSANQFGVNAEQLTWNSSTDEQCLAYLGLKEEQLFCLSLGNQNNVRTVVLGDSTANALVPGLAEMINLEKEGIINLGQGTCPPVRGLVPTARWGGPKSHYAPNCPQVVDRIYDLILSSRTVQTVIISIYVINLDNWGIPSNQENASATEKFQIFKKLLDKDISALQSAGKKVVLVFDTPHLPIEPASCIKRRFSRTQVRNCDIKNADVQANNPNLELFENAYFQNQSVCMVRLSDFLVKDDKIAVFDSRGVLLFRDNHHFSYEGSRQVAQKLNTLPCFKSSVSQ